MYGHACASTRHVSAAGTANTAAPTTSATAVVECVSCALATSAFHPACSAAEARTSASAATVSGSAHQLGEPGCGDVASGERDPHTQARGIDLAREQRREGRGAAGLGDGLGALEEQAHGVDDLGVGDRDDLVDERLDDREGQLAGHRELLAVGDRARDVDPDALARGQRADEVVA